MVDCLKKWRGYGAGAFWGGEKRFIHDKLRLGQATCKVEVAG